MSSPLDWRSTAVPFAGFNEDLMDSFDGDEQAVRDLHSMNPLEPGFGVSAFCNSVDNASPPRSTSTNGSLPCCSAPSHVLTITFSMSVLMYDDRLHPFSTENRHSPMAPARHAWFSRTEAVWALRPLQARRRCVLRPITHFRPLSFPYFPYFPSY